MRLEMGNRNQGKLPPAQICVINLHHPLPIIGNEAHRLIHVTRAQGMAPLAQAQEVMVERLHRRHSRISNVVTHLATGDASRIGQGNDNKDPCPGITTIVGQGSTTTVMGVLVCHTSNGNDIRRLLLGIRATRIAQSSSNSRLSISLYVLRS